MTTAGSAYGESALSRYDALLSVTKSLAEHRSIEELFASLGEHLHRVVPFDYLALILHNAESNEMELAVLEPSELPRPPRERVPVAELGPAATVWTTQE